MEMNSFIPLPSTPKQQPLFRHYVIKVLLLEGSLGHFDQVIPILNPFLITCPQPFENEAQRKGQFCKFPDRLHHLETFTCLFLKGGFFLKKKKKNVVGRGCKQEYKQRSQNSYYLNIISTCQSVHHKDVVFTRLRFYEYLCGEKRPSKAFSDKELFSNGPDNLCA